MDRPKFGSQNNSNTFSSSTKKEEKKEEVGAVWSKKTKNNDDLLTIRLNKVKLKQLLESQDDDIHVRLVAYHNDRTSDKQPNFRIYEDSYWEKK